jgi:hypothetical protein
MRLIGLAVATLRTAAPGIAETPSRSPASAALEKLRGLAGEWSGTYEWSGAQIGGGTLTVQYSLTARGSAVTETLIQGGEPTMTSVYHLDGADLRMTHYCGAQNQPRLKSSRIDPARGEIDFAFVDVTNLASPAAGHVHGAHIRMPDPDHLTIVFDFLAGEKKSTERIALTRTARKAG